MEARAEELGFRQASPKRSTYMIIPGYAGRQPKSRRRRPPSVPQPVLIKPSYTQSLSEWLFQGIIKVQRATGRPNPMKQPTPSRRFWFVGGVLTLAGLFIFIWMIRILTSPRRITFREIGIQVRELLRKPIYPERGNIYDRWGHLLAGNIEIYEIGADLRYVSDPQTIAATLSSILGVGLQHHLRPRQREMGFRPPALCQAGRFCRSGKD